MEILPYKSDMFSYHYMRMWHTPAGLLVRLYVATVIHGEILNVYKAQKRRRVHNPFLLSPRIASLVLTSIICQRHDAR